VSSAAHTRDEAIRLLYDTERYCEGADSLAALGDPSALLELAAAYQELEDVPKRCLIEAIRALDGASAAEGLYRTDVPAARRGAVLLMRLAPDERHLAPLEEALGDEDRLVRWQAREALASQPRTAAWEEALVRVLETGEPAARTRAAEILAGRVSRHVRVALERRAVEDSDDEVRAAIRRTLEATS
jgi:HEAT repeat protein